MGFVVGKILLVLVITIYIATDVTSQERYLDKLVVEFLPNGNEVKLVEQLRFVDKKKQVWVVPAGAVVDGASIPRALWTIVGSPLTGKYRDASVIHDYYCSRKSQNWQVVHRVFYEAMLASGVDKMQAAYLYWAVSRFGPRWDVLMKGHCWPERCFGGPPPSARPLPPIDQPKLNQEEGVLGSYVENFAPAPPTEEELLRGKRFVEETLRRKGGFDDNLRALLFHAKEEGDRELGRRVQSRGVEKKALNWGEMKSLFEKGTLDESATQRLKYHELHKPSHE